MMQSGSVVEPTVIVLKVFGFFLWWEDKKFKEIAVQSYTYFCVGKKFKLYLLRNSTIRQKICKIIIALEHSETSEMQLWANKANSDFAIQEKNTATVSTALNTSVE